MRIGKNLSFVSALSILRIKKASLTLKRTYRKKLTKPKELYGKGSNWGIWAQDQAHAKALAVALGCKIIPEVHGHGYYGHYHDYYHNIHIWYGNSIRYFGKR